VKFIIYKYAFFKVSRLKLFCPWDKISIFEITYKFVSILVSQNSLTIWLVIFDLTVIFEFIVYYLNIFISKFFLVLNIIFITLNILLIFFLIKFYLTCNLVLFIGKNLIFNKFYLWFIRFILFIFFIFILKIWLITIYFILDFLCIKIWFLLLIYLSNFIYIFLIKFFKNSSLI